MQLLNLAKKLDNREQRHVTQSYFAKIRYYKKLLVGNSAIAEVNELKIVKFTATGLEPRTT